MAKSNTYRREINDHTYYVKIFETWLYTTVAIRDSRWNGNRTKTYKKDRRWFCDDTESFAAELLSRAVESREQRVQESQEYDERMERVLDIVEGEYES